MEIAEKIRGKGASLLGRLDQPLQHRVGVDCKAPRRGTDTQALSQAGSHVYDSLYGSLFPMEERAMRFQKIPLARHAVKLTPGADARMAIGA